MSSERDYYDELGVSRTATPEEIRHSFRKLAHTTHPDVSEAPDAHERFAAISEAYEVLSDEEKRARYDRYGRAGVTGTAGPGGPDGFGHADFESLFQEMFGGRGSPFSDVGATAPRARHGADLRHRLTVSFMTAALGGTETFRLASQGRRDSGDAPESISVDIPPGIESGATLRVSGRGAPGGDGGPAGDLLLEIEVGEHPWFRRDGLDVMIDVPITVAESALGARIEIPLLSGSAEIRIPPGADSGRRLRLRGRGITDPQGRKGDLYAEVHVVAPRDLSAEARGLLEALAPELKNPRESGPWSPQRTARSG